MDYREKYGDWALVLGGSEGLGRAMARELAARGMSVALAARRTGPLDEAAAAITAEYGVATKTMALDLSAPHVVEAIEEGMEGEQVVFIAYNAASEPYGEFVALDMEEHERNLAVNVIAPTRIVHHFGRRMVERKRGGIVLCCSLASSNGLYMWVAYGASKAYMHIMGEGIWYELGQHGVDACAFMIGTTWTDNFQRTQERLGGIYAKGRVPDDLPPEMAIPQLPEEAAGNLFTQLDEEWLPLVYANPQDEKRVKMMQAADKAELIRMAAQGQRDWYR